MNHQLEVKLARLRRVREAIWEEGGVVPRELDEAIAAVATELERSPEQTLEAPHNQRAEPKETM